MYVFFAFQLENLKDTHLERQTDDLVVLEPNVDVLAFNEFCKNIDKELRLLTDSTPRGNAPSIAEHFGSSIYFHRLARALGLLNEMMGLFDKSQKIGVELTTSDDTINIFPETIVNPTYVCVHDINFTVLLKILLKKRMIFFIFACLFHFFFSNSINGFRRASFANMVRRCASLPKRIKTVISLKSIAIAIVHYFIWLCRWPSHHR